MGARGSKTSDIDYKNIRHIMDINLEKRPRRYDHLIIYENDEHINVSFTHRKESKFRNRYRFAILYKPINDIYFADIERIDNYIKNDNIEDTFSFRVIYTDKSGKESQDFSINRFQHYLFWKLLKILNPIVYKENKSIKEKESDL
jgi:hypothetical protein